MKIFIFSFFVTILFFLSCCQNKSSNVQTSYVYDKETFHRQSLHTSYYKHRYYQPLYPVKIQSYENTFVNFQNFLAQHGYKSSYHPLIGIVTEDPQDLESVNQLLVYVQENVKDKEQLQLITDEVLTKVVAYRNLQIGQTLPVPVINKLGKSRLITYKVDVIFDLLGMPAFGLIPNKKRVPPILLFRGTDISATLQGYSSVLADLDLNGPGVTAFYSSQDEIHSWLEKVSLSYPKARAMGYSLGGSFVQYTCICENDLVSKDKNLPSVAFNQPGISEDLLYKWHQIKQEERAPLNGYITEGDLVSTVGKLIGNVKELSLDHPLEPLFAHVTLMSVQQRLYSYSIDVTLKNELDYSARDENIKESFNFFSEDGR